MSNITLYVELGQDSSLTTSPIRIQANNTRELGRFAGRIDINQCLELRNRPTNNIFSVKLVDNMTNAIAVDEYEYVINLNFERIDN